MHVGGFIFPFWAGRMMGHYTVTHHVALIIISTGSISIIVMIVMFFMFCKMNLSYCLTVTECMFYILHVR